ncbi:hypothetical protein [Niabella ginsengisoli]|uniref:Uncharacterized protein n=1 Tax=Niabella ginsengisoli TaxID=522298 RepID=A0ABS9SM19_9BACT|nr:hypothetical protein [Niabella ginsengisoli]MCH5599429.1 hypothetical protein [Niabella ginsengisoli]
MNIKDLETVFLFFYDNRANYHHFKDVKQNLREHSLTDLELLAGLEKLVKDGYIIEEEKLRRIISERDNTVKDEYKTWAWFISYDGIFF